MTDIHRYFTLDGDSENKRYYRQQFEQGYSFESDYGLEGTGLKLLEQRCRELVAQGNEFFVGDKAFDVNGKETSGKALLVKRKQGGQK